MILVPALTALCDSLSTQTGAPVSLGPPEAHASGVIYVWPWKLSEDSAMRNVPGRNVPGRRGRSGDVPQHAAAAIVHAFILTRPATTAAGLGLLDSARQAVLDAPVLDLSGAARGRAQVQFESLSHADLAAVFSAAQLPLSVSLSVIVRASE